MALDRVLPIDSTSLHSLIGTVTRTNRLTTSATSFFDEWDFEQWNLLWNLLANCVQVYLQYGVVEAPQDRIAIRQVRQQMGEVFISWADEYFSDENRIGIRLVKKTLHDDFIKTSNANMKYESITIFKKEADCLL